MITMSGINTGNKHKRLQLSADALKIFVVGGRGKTSFIRSFWERHQPEETYSYNGAEVYPCKFEDSGILRTALIFEIPGDPDFFEQHILHNVDAKIILWMYAFDDPRSVDMLRDDWLPQVAHWIHLDSTVSALVGNKKDLREDPQVIARLALEGRTPVTFLDVEGLMAFGIMHSFDVTAHILGDVDEVFHIMFYIFLHQYD